MHLRAQFRFRPIVLDSRATYSLFALAVNKCVGDDRTVSLLVNYFDDIVYTQSMFNHFKVFESAWIAWIQLFQANAIAFFTNSRFARESGFNCQERPLAMLII